MIKQKPLPSTLQTLDVELEATLQSTQARPLTKLGHVKQIAEDQRITQALNSGDEILARSSDYKGSESQLLGYAVGTSSGKGNEAYLLEEHSWKHSGLFT